MSMESSLLNGGLSNRTGQGSAGRGAERLGEARQGTR